MRTRQRGRRRFVALGPPRGGQALGLAAMVGLGCSPSASRDVRGVAPAQTEGGEDGVEAPIFDAPQALPVTVQEASGRVSTMLDDAELLQDLEAAGLSLHNVLRSASGAASVIVPPSDASTMAELIELEAWQVVQREVGLALDRAAKADAKLGVGLRYSHRSFDRRWLLDPAFSMRLVAVVNRLDRLPFAAQGHCGETRLIYRLAYTTKLRDRELSSRLPMTVNVVFWQDAGLDGSCATAVERWRVDGGQAVSSDYLLRESGPLAPSRLALTLRKSVEIDMQTLRWPSTIRPDLGGHAEYLLAALVWEGSSLRLGPLENTPDVAMLQRDSRMRSALLAWILEPEHASELWRGTAAIPAEFVATTATSVAPFGSLRLANRPFSQLYSADDLVALPADVLKEAGDASAFLRRLDTLSCMGCHQSRSLAGFHALGTEQTDEQTIDALYDGRSPHLHTEVARRDAWFADALGGDLSALSRQRLTAELSDDGLWGSPCRVDGLDRVAQPSGLATSAGRDDIISGDGSRTQVPPWSCAAGLICVSQGQVGTGICLGAPAGAGQSGDPCTAGQVKTRADAHADRRRDITETGCGVAVCNTDEVGFPNGMCTDSCPTFHLSAVDQFSEIGCGAIPNLRAFNDCLSRRVPFDECVMTTASSAAMRSCDAQAHCREDYVCSRSPVGSSQRGVCMPPYFLFQLRVDGHPV